MYEVVLQRSLLRDRRLKAGLTQEQLGELIGKTKQRIHEYEKSPVDMHLTTALLLCEVFRCELVDLFVFEVKRT